MQAPGQSEGGASVDLDDVDEGSSRVSINKGWTIVPRTFIPVLFRATACRLTVNPPGIVSDLHMLYRL